MLIVRPEQLAVFQPVAEIVLVQDVVKYLREEHSDAVVRLPAGEFVLEQLSDETLEEMVAEGIRRGRAYGISWEATLTSFVVLMVVTAPNFDQHPIIKRILRDEQIEPDLRIEELWNLTSEENWEMVEQNYDPQAWNLKVKES